MKRTTLLGGCALGVILAGPVAAETAPGQLEEIVVTAQRRGENLQSVPIAVAAISAAQAAKLGISDGQSLAQVAPGLTMTRSSSGSVPFLRGVGTPSSTIGNEPSVAMFIDDVYVTSGSASYFEFNNLDQIEVLKGPQGTLFGRNATGGVIHIHTRNPTHEPTMDISGTVANYKSYSGQFYGSTGLGENAAVNLAAYGSDQNKGWGRNIVTGNDIVKGWGVGARAKLLWEPTDDTSVLIAGSAERRRHGQGLGTRQVPGAFGRGGFSPDAAGLGFYDAAMGIDNHYTIDYRSLSAKVRHDLGVASFVSISALSRIRSIAAYDSDSAPIRYFDGFVTMQGDVFTQEFQLISPGTSDIDWLLGGFFLHDNSKYRGDYAGQAFGAAGRAGARAGQVTDSWSGFAQATAEILPKTRLTLGVRYTSDKRVHTAATYVGANNVVTPGGRRTFSNLSGRFALDHRFSDEFLGYVAYNRGFKSGIFNLAGQALGSAVTSLPAVPEDLNAYTAGFKSEWWDKRLRLNVEGYYYDYKNIQVTTLVVATQIVTNAGAAKIKGVDIDLVAVPVKNLTINAAVNVADGTYSSFPNGPLNLPLPPAARLPIPPGCGNIAYPTGTGPLANIACDLSGNDTVFTPKFSANLSATWRIPARFPVDLSASWSHKSSFFFEADNSPFVRQKPTDVINASVQVNSPDERYSLRLWAKNLGNREMYSYITQSGTAGIKYSTAPPRTYGVTVSGHF